MMASSNEADAGARPGRGRQGPAPDGQSVPFPTVSGAPGPRETEAVGYSATGSSGGPVGETPPQDFPHVEGYRITGRLGEGGMATVWRAVQLSTQREVALKLIGRGAFASTKAQMRFEREVELAARLDHPNIARVYESGLYRGLYHYAMELIEGKRLDEYVKRRKLPAPEILRLMRAVCLAVQYAHQRGVIHRDLKPSNILVNEDGKPYVLDFGLAKTSPDEEPSIAVSVDGDIAGTPAYMSPEQAAGKVKEIDTRSDVYSLGVILYHLLTGHWPHDHSTGRRDLLRQIIGEDVIRPSRWVKRFDRELEAVLLKALARDPADRYASAGQLAQDLKNYLTGEPLAARKPTTFYFLAKRARKHAVGLGLAAAVALAGVGGIVFYVLAIRTEQRRTHLAKVREMRQRQAAEISAGHAAEHRRLALETLNRLVFEVQRKLSRARGQIKLRRELIDVAVEGLRRIQDAASNGQLAPDRSLAAAMIQIGDVLRSAGRVPEARDAYSGALQRFQALARLPGDALLARHDLSVARTRLGLVCLQTGDRAAGRKHLLTALDLTHRLVQARPNDRQMLHDQWALHVAMGDLEMGSAGPAAAEDHFGRAKALAETLKARREVSISLKRLGDAAMRRDDPAGAAKLFGRALALDEAALAAESEDLQAKRDLSVSLAKLGEASFRTGRTEAARGRYRRAVRLLEELAGHDPDRFDVRADLAATAFMLGEANRAEGKAASAGAWYRRAVDILSALERQGKLDDQPRYAALLAKARSRLADTRGGPRSRPASAPAAGRQRQGGPRMQRQSPT